MPTEFLGFGNQTIDLQQTVGLSFHRANIAADFISAGDAVALTPSGRKGFFRAYEQRMDQLVTHPLFGYRVSYRRLVEIQTRLLARVLLGELRSYPVFITR